MAKVIFLHLFVILFTGGGSASMHARIPTPNPPGQGRPHRTRQTSPQSRHPPGPGRHPIPPTRQTPPWTRQTPPPNQANTPPPKKQTPAYGLRAASTHPTGMHSCFCYRSAQMIDFYDVSNLHTKLHSSLVAPDYPGRMCPSSPGILVYASCRPGRQVVRWLDCSSFPPTYKDVRTNIQVQFTSNQFIGDVPHYPWEERFTGHYPQSCRSTCIHCWY